jgi:hypothetical protein
MRREVGRELAEPEAAVGVGIEEPHLDVRMRVERRDRVVEPARAVVVEQQPHAHAALGRAPQGFAQKRAGDIGAPDLVLHVEAAVSGLGKHHPRGECVARARERMDRALAGVRGKRRRQRAAKARGRGVGGRGRMRPIGDGGQARAAGERDERLKC